MMRVSPPELARECAGPWASISATRWPRLARCHAVHAPKTPAPITATSNVFWLLTARASYRNLYPKGILTDPRLASGLAHERSSLDDPEHFGAPFRARISIGFFSAVLVSSECGHVSEW